MVHEKSEHIDNEFSGEGESVVQAGAIHGDIHFHGSKRTNFPPPRQLPAGVAGFVNRESSIEQLNSLLASSADNTDKPRSSIVVISAITGAPGVGKTALALHWAHQARHHFPDGDLYVDMRGYGSGTPLSLEQALDAFLRSLNVAPEYIPIDVDERAALYRSIIGDKRMLIVIDNVASVKQVRRLLPGSNRCLALVTSRSRVSSLVAREGAKRVTIDVLSPEDAIRLLGEIIGEERVESDYEAAGRVAELCSYLPLALRVVAERAASRPHLSLSELVNELMSEQSRLDALASEEDELTDVSCRFFMVLSRAVAGTAEGVPSPGTPRWGGSQQRRRGGAR
ncbi:MAG: NB-ARC domain-containing protein [Candidatus Angelobacter sp.]